MNKDLELRGDCQIFICTGFEALKASRQIIHRFSKGRPSYIFWFGGDRGQDEIDEPFTHLFEFKTAAQGMSYGELLQDFSRILGENSEKFKDADIFIPHPYHFAANYFLNKPNIAGLYLLPDGMINYSHRKLTLVEKLKSLAKLIYGWIYHVHYYPCVRSLHITRYEDLPYVATFTFEPRRLVTTAGSVFVLDDIINKNDYVSEPGRILFLDQEITEIFSKDLAYAIRMAAFSFMENLNANEIYYKPHPKGQNRINLLRSIIPEAILLEKKGAVENIIGELRVEKCVSFYSTALLVLRRMTTVETISILPSAPPNHTAEFVEGIAKSFDEHGIIVLRVKTQPIS
ncbi:polysialyltransferase family glycosyltransferase [Tistrella mobilis]|uniref:polysialyltransferase family glycosyltransferase n=1 Tax=Tistrella mobilis TaxID=171437 RepID=UPI0031F6A00B